MQNLKNLIGVDVGGSHVTAALFDGSNSLSSIINICRKNINPLDDAQKLLTTIAQCIIEVNEDASSVNTVGIAFPGPFDYEKGISAINNVGGKFESTFGLNVHSALKSLLPFDTSLHFANDAHCFAQGAFTRYQLKGKRIVFLTLGTGFGSAFMVGDQLIYNHAALPDLCAFYNEDFLEGKADDYFSTRWILNEYQTRTGKEIASVKELAVSNSATAIAIFKDFGKNLGTFLLPNLRNFECDQLIIGGNISRAKLLFQDALFEELSSTKHNIIFTDDTEECILAGAARLALQHKQQTFSNAAMRKTNQYLLPISATINDKQSYNIYPSFASEYPVFKGFSDLAELLFHKKTITIDGYGGVQWELFREQLNTEFQKRNISVFWYDVNVCLKPADEIDIMIATNINGDDPVFGKRYEGDLIDFFDVQKLKLIKPDPQIELCIVYGTGAALVNWEGPLVYLDVPKNEIQYRMRAGGLKNIGSDFLLANTQSYKRCYFVDWPVLNKHKAKLLSKLDYIVDEQRLTEITWMKGEDFRIALSQLLTQSIRPRPWFEAGVWGGQWMKNHISGLYPDEVNYAWSFELIAPENGIVINGNNNLLEVSFDYLMYYDNKKLLGKAANKFGTEFPIRFDFLDTFDGGNLSIQCHPQTAYIKEKFGENFTQDETYYILDATPEAQVYLGFQHDIQPDEFKRVLQDAQQNNKEIDIEQYVQIHPAPKHELFLIPGGTIHASGKNTMVLEISSTPYIFTFKMYDWKRLDLNGQPRPINIEHAFNNLNFDRKGDYVSQQLISKPQVIETWNTCRKINLPTHEEHFYAVDRYEFTGKITINTNGHFHLCMLVQGQNIDVTTSGKTNTFCYAETFLIPAAAENYIVHNHHQDTAFFVVAYIKDSFLN